MKLHELLLDCCTDLHDLKRLITDALDDDGREAWAYTGASQLGYRAEEMAERLRKKGIAQKPSPLYTKLVEALPGRADDVVATCREETGQALTWSVDPCGDEDAFDWGEHQAGMSPSLRRFLGHAGYDARTRIDKATGKPHTTISTSEVFRVYRALQPWVLAVFGAERLKKPARLADDEADNVAAVFDRNLLGASFCVQKTVTGLLKHTPANACVTEHDVFFDLVRFGGGRSARRFLSTDGDLDRFNELSRSLGLGRVTRHGPLAERG